MRKIRDGEDTRQRVLSAAEELFAMKGFAGTSLADISQRCGISDGLILHHFQNKRNLYHQVMENLAEQYIQYLARAKEQAASPQEVLPKTLTAAFEFWQHNTAYQRISLWSYLEGQSEMEKKEAGLTVALYQEVKRLQDQGMVDNRVSPVVFLTMVIGPIHSWLRYRDQFKEILNLPESPEELDKLFSEQVTQLIMEMSQKKI